ncbi:hypothetical protein MMC25_006202 [Agyrium rufum]|nr:hypothetical protein [Agyrium rufum]
MSHKSIIFSHCPPLGSYEDVYRDIHRNPELSKHEVRTAKIVADHLTSLSSFVVHTGIGGHGVVGVLHNGPGPTVLLRADMDALPHLENTGLEYASTKIFTDAEGKQTPVMHACGHDMHVATLMAASTLLQSARAEWSGTLICLFQPNEETAGGAKAMVADGLYDPKRKPELIPIPDIVLGQHVHAIKAGTVAIGGGPILTAVDSLEIRIFGRSGHISRADLCVDPVLTASHIIVRLQGLVTKNVRPEDFAVIACASIHGGSVANIVPDYVDLKLSLRSYRKEVHERLLAAIEKVVRAECDIAGSPREPEIKTIMQAPATVNDIASAAKLKGQLESYFGANCIDSDPFGASEDFSVLATSCGAPYVFYMYGCVDEEIWDKASSEGKLHEIPHNHSAFFAPVIKPTMKTGVDAFAVGALTFLGGKRKG